MGPLLERVETMCSPGEFAFYFEFIVGFIVIIILFCFVVL